MSQSLVVPVVSLQSHWVKGVVAPISLYQALALVDNTAYCTCWVKKTRLAQKLSYNTGEYLRAISLKLRGPGVQTFKCRLGLGLTMHKVCPWSMTPIPPYLYCAWPKIHLININITCDPICATHFSIKRLLKDLYGANLPISPTNSHPSYQMALFYTVSQ